MALVFAPCVVLPATPASSQEPSLDLPFLARIDLPSLSCGVVVDEVQEHVFVSQPEAIVVFGYDGTHLATFASDGPCGMTVVDSTVYVVERGAGTVRRIDSASLTDQGVLAGGLVEPRRITVAAGKLWTSTQVLFGQQLVSVGFDGTVTTMPFPAPGGVPFEPLSPIFAASAARPSDLYVADGGSSNNQIQRLDVSGAEPVLRGSVNVDQAFGFRELSLTPDGTRLIVAVPAPYVFMELDASTLADTGVRYDVSGLGYPSAISVSPALGGLVATARSQEQGPDITVEPIGPGGHLRTLP